MRTSALATPDTGLGGSGQGAVGAPTLGEASTQGRGGQQARHGQRGLTTGLAAKGKTPAWGERVPERRASEERPKSTTCARGPRPERSGGWGGWSGEAMLRPSEGPWPWPGPQRLGGHHGPQQPTPRARRPLGQDPRVHSQSRYYSGVKDVEKAPVS